MTSPISPLIPLGKPVYQILQQRPLQLLLSLQLLQLLQPPRLALFDQMVLELYILLQTVNHFLHKLVKYSRERAPLPIQQAP